MTTLLRFFLALVGLGVLIIGVNVGFGGIRTLGLQVDPGFVTANDPIAFTNQDSHVRFLGGVFAAIGLTFLIGAATYPRLRNTLIALSLVVAVAGLARFSQGALGPLLTADLLPSLIFELVCFPVLALWMSRTPS